MCGKIVSTGIGKAVEDILGKVPAGDRAEAIEEIRAVLNREMFGLLTDIPDIRCPKCGCTDHMRNGHTRIGTQRYICKECGNTYCNIEGGLIIRNTKLDNSKWMAFAECFIDGLSCKRTAEKIHVTPRTAWFMRVRTLEALQKNLPSFEVKADSGAEIDEIFFPESFKGISFKNLGRIPREPRREGRGTRTRGISNEQICVVTGINDNGDMFYDVACRGRRTDPRQ
jgi:transposase-like protein